MTDLAKLTPLLAKLGKEGLLLTSGKKPNTMVISWGSAGVYWNEPVFIAPVRLSRYTRELMDECGCFSVCVPTEELKAALKVFGSESGRDIDKYQKTGVKTVKCKSIPTCAIEGAALTVECQIIGEMEMDADCTEESIRKRWYEDEDFHIMYYGKIVNIY